MTYGAQFVIASPLERGDMIVEQIRALEEGARGFI